ncbi:MAG TPA: hypothetical protein VFX01_03690, partial [Methylophilaceae bacterium]|nr:hypothetical protein [Methylophilaceae bacterium]
MQQLILLAQFFNTIRVEYAAYKLPVSQQIAQQHQYADEKQTPIPWTLRPYGDVFGGGAEMTFNPAGERFHGF